MEQSGPKAVAFEEGGEPTTIKTYYTIKLRGKRSGRCGHM